MFAALLPLLTSKKFQLAILALLAHILARYGLNMDPTQALEFISPLIAAIIGQGIADHGKEAAKIAAAAANDNTPIAAPVSTPVRSQAGFISRTVLAAIAVLGIAGGALVVSCAWTKQEARVVKTAAVDCTKGEEAKAVKLFSPMLDQLLVLATGGDGKLDTSQLDSATKTLAGDIGGCVLSTSIAKALNPSAPQPGAPQSSPLVIDAAAARLYFESVRAVRFDGKTFQTEAGPL